MNRRAANWGLEILFEMLGLVTAWHGTLYLRPALHFSRAELDERATSLSAIPFLTTASGSLTRTSSAELVVPADARPPRFAYVANLNSNNVSAYTVDGVSGALTPVAGSPFAAGTAPASVTVDPTGQFAYVANPDSDSVSAYRINANTGALTPVPGSPFASDFAYDVAVDPSGRFAYVANGIANTVSAYSIDITSGALTPLPGSPFAAGTNPVSLAVHPTGRFAYALNADSNNVSAFTINASTGALTPISGQPFAAGTNPVSVAMHPTGRFAYVVNATSTDVSAYTINGSTGALTPVPGSPFGTDPFPYSIAVDPTGQFAYVANYDSNTISAYAINATTGALTPVPGSPFRAGVSPYAVTVDPTGKFAYLANDSDNTISDYRIDASTGALTLFNSFATGSSPAAVTTTSGYADFSLAATPSSQTVLRGASTSYTATITALGGFSGVVQLSVSGLPTGANGSFSPPSVTGSGSSTLNVTTSTTTPVGSYPLTITGSHGSLTRTSPVTLVIAGPDFSLALAPSSRTVLRGASTSYTATITASGGFSGVVQFSVSGLPAGTDGNFIPRSVTGSGSSTLTVNTSSDAALGSYPLTITATSGSLTRTSGINLIVQPANSLETVTIDFSVAQRSYAVTNFFDGPGMSVHAAASAGLNLHSMWTSARAWFAENKAQPGYETGNRLVLHLSCDWGHQDPMCQPPFGTGQGCEADCFGNICGQGQLTPCPSEDPTQWHAHLDNWIATVSASRTDWNNIVILGWNEPEDTYRPRNCLLSDRVCRATELVKAWKDTLTYVRNKLPGSNVRFAMPPVSSYFEVDFVSTFLDAIKAEPTFWPDYVTINDNGSLPTDWDSLASLMKSLLDSSGITVRGFMVPEYSGLPQDPDVMVDQLHWGGGTVHHFAKAERAFDRYFPGMDNSLNRGCESEEGMHTRTGRQTSDLSNCVNGSITALLMDQWGSSGPWRQGAPRCSYYAFKGYQSIKGPHVKVTSSLGDQGVVDGVAGTDSLTSARIVLGVTENASPTALTLTLANVPSAFLSSGKTCLRYWQIPNRRSEPAIVPPPITTLVVTSMGLSVNAGEVLIMQLAKPASDGSCTGVTFDDL